MIALLELAVHAHSFCAWYWFNKRIVFIVRVYRGVDVFDHRISNYCYCFLLSIVFLIFVCWPSNCLYGSIIFAFMFVEGSASETIALSLYMRGTAIFSYLLMIFDLIAKSKGGWKINKRKWIIALFSKVRCKTENVRKLEWFLSNIWKLYKPCYFSFLSYCRKKHPKSIKFRALFP